MDSKAELVVSFIHSNYLTKSGGTEKFVSELSKVLSNKGYSHLCFFSFTKKRGLFGEKIVGVVYNDVFVDIVAAKDMKKVVSFYLQKEGVRLNAFHIQHLKYHDLDWVQEVITSFQASIYFFVHDFYISCHSEHLINSQGEFCGEGKSSDLKCSQCTFYTEEKAHLQRMMSFIHNIEDQLAAVIVPSCYVQNVLIRTYPTLEDKIIIRPHLVSTGFKKMLPLSENETIRIAFIGRQHVQKGYDKWRMLLTALKSAAIDGYEFFYFGIDQEQIEGVRNCYVSTTKQGPDAMTNRIAEDNISCAFLWPQCPETYSYAYYELLSSGVFILTNDFSGNILDEIRQYRNGKAFASFNECKNWLMDINKARKDINKFRIEEDKVPSEYRNNTDVSCCVSDDAMDCTGYPTFKRYRRNHILKALYKIKYREYNV